MTLTTRIRTLASAVFRWLLLSGAAVFIWRMVSRSKTEIIEAVHHLAHSEWGYVIVAIACEVAWTWALAQMYRAPLVAMGGAVTRGDVLRVSMGAFSLSRFMPGGGAVGSLYAARELMARGNGGTTTLASMVTSWWFSMASLTCLVLGGVTTGVLTGIVEVSAMIAPSATLTILTVGAVVVVTALEREPLRRRVLALAHKAVREHDVADPSGTEFLATLHRFDLRGAAVVSFWAAGSWALDATALWAIGRAFGVHVPLAGLMLAYGAANMLQALPELTPGWLGVFEATMAGTLAAFGADPGVAIVAVLAYRLISYWLPVAAGSPMAMGMLRSHGASRRHPAAAYDTTVAA